MNGTRPFRYSRQREKILEMLRESKDHPSADIVYEKMKGSFPSISLGTVYRNLSVLNEQGLVNRIMHPGGPDRFDADIYNHSHFYCENCGTIYDVKDISNGEKPGFTSDGHNVRRQITSYYGICSACCKKSQ